MPEKVNAFRVQRLCQIPVVFSFFCQAVFTKQVCQSKRSIRFLLLEAQLTYVTRDRLYRLNIFTVATFFYPVAQCRCVDVIAKSNGPCFVAEFMNLGIGAFVDSHDSAFFINPGGGGDVNKIECTADDMVCIDNLNVGRVGGIENWARYCFTACIFCNAEDDKIRIVYFFVDLLPHGHI